jgi:hypothetical protein
MRTFNAAALKIECLYHYQPYRPEWIEQIPIGNRLFFSNPQYFNDPWDFRPGFNLGILNDPAVYERHARWIEASSRKHDAHLPEEEHLRRAQKVREDRAYLVWFINEMSARMSQATADRYRVYCVSTKADNTLMWSHYAASHTGICLEFNCRNIIFGTAIRVEYIGKYPAFDLSDNEDDTILLPWLTKSDAWSYEDEFRVIAQEKSTHPPEGVLATYGGVLKLPTRVLESVILGCSVTPAAAAHVQRLIQRQIFPPIALKRMTRHPDRYELSIEMVG